MCTPFTFLRTVVQLLRGVQNVTYIQRNYLHTVIAVENMQIMGHVLDVFKQRTGNTFSIHRHPKEFGDRDIVTELNAELG